MIINNPNMSVVILVRGQTFASRALDGISDGGREGSGGKEVGGERGVESTRREQAETEVRGGGISDGGSRDGGT